MRARRVLAVMFACAAAGCGGGGAAVGPPGPGRPSAAPASHERVAVTVRVRIPKTKLAQIRRRRDEHREPHRAYVSPAIAYFTITNDSRSEILAEFSLDTTGSTGAAAACRPVPGGDLQCTTQAAFPVGTASYRFFESNRPIKDLRAGNLFDAQYVLGASRMLVTINPPGQPNDIAVTFGGVPAQLQLTLAAASPALGKPATVPVLFIAFDRQNDAIVGGDPFYDLTGNPAPIRFTLQQKTAIASLQADGGAPDPASVSVATPSDTVALLYNGGAGVADVVPVLDYTGAPLGINSALFVPGRYTPNYHDLTLTVPNVPGAVPLDVAPAADGSATAEFAYSDNGSNQGLVRVDEAGNASATTPFATVLGPIFLFRLPAAAGSGYRAFGGTELATIDGSGHTAFQPYTPNPLPPAFYFSTGYPTLTDASGAAIQFNYQGTNRVDVTGATFEAPAVGSSNPLDMCPAPDGSLVELFLGNRASMPALRVDPKTGALLDSSVFASEDTPLACALSVDKRSLYIIDGGGTSITTYTFAAPATLSGATVTNHPFTAGVAATPSSFAPTSMIVADPATGDHSVYAAFGGPYSNQNGIVQIDLDSYFARIFNRTAYIPHLVRGNDGNLWYFDANNGIGYFQVHP